MAVSIVINRNSGTFDKQVADELNNAFYKINKRIEEYQSIPLDYKNKVSAFGSSNTFMTDNVLHVRETFNVDTEEKLKDVFLGFTKIATLPEEVPFDVWGTSASKDNKTILTYHIMGKEIFITGNTFLNQSFVIVEDIIIP